MPARVIKSLTELSRRDRAPGIVLAVATFAALVWANAWDASYRDVVADVRGVVNEGLMTAFFLLVGLEIRREIVSGELRTLRRAAPPIVAGVAGMVVPAAIYAAVVHGGPGRDGWGVPMATDIAFALGAIALVDADLSLRARTFLLTLAVADDVLAIVVLVVFYGGRVDPFPVVGVVAGLLLPSRALGPRTLERLVQPWVVLVVLPAFALANAGVRLDPHVIATGSAGVVFVAVVVARVLGKPLGIGAAVVAMRVAHRGTRADLGHLLSAGAVAAAGFTVPLFVVDVALPDGPIADAARAGLLLSTVAAVAAGRLVHAVADRGRRARGLAVGLEVDE